MYKMLARKNIQRIQIRKYMARHCNLISESLIHQLELPEKELNKELSQNKEIAPFVCH